MRLEDIFRRNSQVADGSEAARMQGNVGRNANASVSRQIQAMIPGQTIQGEIVSRNGNEIQIRLADDYVLNARLDQSMNLEVGKNLAFQVKNNGQSLLLSPLFTNTAIEGTVLKALNMAGLPVAEDTVAMTGQMMEAGLPVDKNTLQQLFRETNLYPEASTQDIVDLHKLGLPVNESSVSQIGSYKNFTHQLLQGMNDLMFSLAETLDGMQSGGEVREAAQLFQQIVAVVSGEELPEEEAAAARGEQEGLQEEQAPPKADGEPADLRPSEQAAQDTPREATVVIREDENVFPQKETGEEPRQAEAAKTVRENAAPEKPAGEVRETEPKEREATGKSAETRGAQDTPVKVLRETVAQMEKEQGSVAERRTANDVPESAAGERQEVFRQPQTFSQALHQVFTGGSFATDQEQLALVRELLNKGLETGDKGLLRELLDNREVRDILSGRLEALFTASPEEIEDAKSVEALYQRLDRQLKGMGKALESAGQADSAAYRVVQNMNQNLDFLQQINQVYTYVQLPVRLQQGNAHGDLYVYTNKKSLASKDGQISALLHLDMEHLGPVDVYVVMQSEKVNTKFYVQDDAMLDFLEEHMDLLTERLKRRGYDMTAQMLVREETSGGSAMGAMAPLLPEENQGGVSMLQKYAFDVRA